MNAAASTALKRAFVDAFNSLIENKAEIIEGCLSIIDTLMDTSALDEESTKLQAQCEAVLKLIRGCVDENARSALDQSGYQRRYSAYVEQYQAAKGRLAEIDALKLERRARREQIEAFLHRLLQSGALLTEFDEELWYATVDTVTVHSGRELTFKFKDGMEVPWKV